MRPHTVLPYKRSNGEYEASYRPWSIYGQRKIMVVKSKLHTSKFWALRKNQFAREELQKAQSKHKAYHDRKAERRTFVSGDKVLILLPTSSNKLLMAWKGPYMVDDLWEDTDFRVSINGKLMTYHVNIFKKFYQWKKNRVLKSQFLGGIIWDGWDDSWRPYKWGRYLIPDYKDIWLRHQLTEPQWDEARALITEFWGLLWTCLVWPISSVITAF